MLFKIALTFQSEVDTVECDHSNEGPLRSLVRFPKCKCPKHCLVCNQLYYIQELKD